MASIFIVSPVVIAVCIDIFLLRLATFCLCQHQCQHIEEIMVGPLADQNEQFGHEHMTIPQAFVVLLLDLFPRKTSPETRQKHPPKIGHYPYLPSFLIETSAQPSQYKYFQKNTSADNKKDYLLFF